MCDICMDSVKNLVTRCGRGCSADCLSTWSQVPEDGGDIHSTGQLNMGDCPICGKIGRAGEDVWPVYLGGENHRPDVVVLDSDSESE